MGDDSTFLPAAFFKASLDFVSIGQESDFFYHVLILPVNLLQRQYNFFTIILNLKQGKFENGTSMPFLPIYELLTVIRLRVMDVCFIL